MQEENWSTWRKTCRSKFGLETKWTYPGSVVHSAEEVPLHYLLTQTVLEPFTRDLGVTLLTIILTCMGVSNEQTRKQLWDYETEFTQ